MKFTVEYYDTKVTVEDRDDLVCDEMLDLFIAAMGMMGYHPESIKNAILELAESYEDSRD